MTYAPLRTHLPDDTRTWADFFTRPIQVDCVTVVPGVGEPTQARHPGRLRKPKGNVTGISKSTRLGVSDAAQ